MAYSRSTCDSADQHVEREPFLDDVPTGRRARQPQAEGETLCGALDTRGIKLGGAFRGPAGRTTSVPQQRYRRARVARPVGAGLT